MKVLQRSTACLNPNSEKRINNRLHEAHAYINAKSNDPFIIIAYCTHISAFNSCPINTQNRE